MEHYVRPEVLASYSEAELVEEAAICHLYGLTPPIDRGN